MPRGRSEPAPRDDRGRYAPDRSTPDRPTGGGGGRFGCLILLAWPGLLGVAGGLVYLAG